MKQKYKIVNSVLQILILCTLILIRYYGGQIHPYLNHFLEVLIVTALLGFGENSIMGIIILYFLVSYNLKLISRFVRYKIMIQTPR